MANTKEGFLSGFWLGFWLGFTFLFKSWISKQSDTADEKQESDGGLESGGEAGFGIALLILLAALISLMAFLAMSVVTGVVCGIVMSFQGDEANTKFRDQLEQTGRGTAILLTIIGVTATLFLYSGLTQMFMPGSTLPLTLTYITSSNALIFTIAGASALLLAAVATVAIPALFYSSSPPYQKTDFTEDEQRHLQEEQSQTQTHSHTVSVRTSNTILPDFESANERKDE